MERRKRDAYSSKIRQGWRSLDLNSLYESMNAKGRKRKRKIEVDHGGQEKRYSRKKSRKLVSANGFTNKLENCSEMAEESFSGRLKLSSGGLNESGRHGDIVLFLKDVASNVPRRKRDYMGLRKAHHENEALNSAGRSSGKMVHVDPTRKMNIDDRGKWNHFSKRKRKKDLKEIKDILKLNYARKLGEECEKDGASGMNNSHFTSNKVGQYAHPEENYKKSNLKKSLTETSSSRKVSTEKQRRRSRDVVNGSENRVRKAEPSASSCTRIDNDGLDDEENLEENAARMLSSRFDPSCTRFSSNTKASALPPVNESALLSPSGPSHTNHESNLASGSESTSSGAGATKRASRSREWHKQKGGLRKWRRYYEILFDDVDAYWILKHRIKVFWPMDQSWYYGLVRDYDDVRKLHHIQYDDRDEEWIDLQKERFKLLLLPTEVPVGLQQKNYVALENHMQDVEKTGSTVRNGSCEGNCMDSEPIISWMVRSSRRQVFSSLRMRERKLSCVLPQDSISAPSSEELSGNFYRYRLSSEDSDLPMGSSPVVPASATDCCACSTNHILLDNCKLPIVYYRRRFRKRNVARQATGVAAQASNVMIFHGADMVMAEEEIDGADVLPSDDGMGLLQLHFMLNVSIQALSVMYCCSLGVECTLWSRAVFLLQYGRLIVAWPRVCLEIQFFGNIAGPTCLLFEGCLRQAIHFTFLVLALLSQPNEQKKYSDLQFPVSSSIRFRFSLLSNQRKHLLFACSPLGEVKNLKWINLEHEIRRYCSHTGEIFQLKCIYGSIKANVEVSNISSSSFCDNPISVKEQWESCGQRRISVMDLPREPTYVNSNLPQCSSSGVKEEDGFHRDNLLHPMGDAAAVDRCLSHSECDHDPVTASIDAAADSSSSPVHDDDGSVVTGLPSPRRSDQHNNKKLHGLNMCGVNDQIATAPNPIARRSNWHQNRVCVNDQIASGVKEEDGFCRDGLLPPMKDAAALDICSSLSECGYVHVGTSIDAAAADSSSSPIHDDGSVVTGLPSPKRSEKLDNKKLHGLNVCDVNDQIAPAPNPTARRSNWHQNGAGVNVQIASGVKVEDGFCSNNLLPPMRDAAALDRCSSLSECCHDRVSASIDAAADSSSSPVLDDGGVITGLPSPKRSDQHNHKKMHMLNVCDVNDQTAPAPNPTARRSHWHRNRVGLMGCGSHINGWSDGRAEFLQNSFGDGPKKPRTHVSYGGFSSSGCSTGGSSHQHRGVTQAQKQTCIAGERRGLERSLEDACCDANVLIVDSDRGWRECGVQVVMESFDHTERMLAVKQSGTTKYVYKAYHFLQPGSTNRFTHAMMWKGGKDWILEFPDRTQWSLFKKMYEECYKCNIRAASVRNIPIPGVRLIEENPDRWMAMPFVRNNAKYFRQVETDMEMALNPSRVLYDMDSDDESWVLENKTSSQADGSGSWEITDEFFEKMMDFFEKAAHSQNHEQFTFDNIEHMTAGFGHLEAIKKIHEYWKCKRQDNGIPLIRHLQPPLWEVYQQRVAEWELAMAKNKTLVAGDCHGKVDLTEKPPVFAFCLKPLGLEVPYKGSKHRSSQRRFPINNSLSNHSFLADNNGGFHSDGRRWNAVVHGDEKLTGTHNNHEFLDSFSLHMVSPEEYAPQEVDDKYPMEDAQNHKKMKSKKLGTFLSPTDTRRNRLFEKRSGVQWWNYGYFDHPFQRNLSDVYPRQESESLDVGSTARSARLMAKMKRERAARLLYQADLAIHKATVALMTAEAIKATASDDGSDNGG